MGERRMKYSYIDILFINISEITYNIKRLGINSFLIEQVRLSYKQDDIVYRYLTKGIELAKKGYIREKLNGELSFELSKICGNSNIDDTQFKALHIVKSLIEPMINGDYSFILEFSKYYCTKDVYAVITKTFRNILHAM